MVIHWLIFPYPSGLLHWHCGNLTIAPVPAKQPWWIWINTSCEFIMNDCITTTKQSTTKPCAYFLQYTVCRVMEVHATGKDCLWLFFCVLISDNSWDHFYSHGLTSIPAWISNLIQYNVRGELIYPFPNFYGTTDEVWERISNFIPHFTGYVILIHVGIKSVKGPLLVKVGPDAQHLNERQRKSAGHCYILGNFEF